MFNAPGFGTGPVPAPINNWWSKPVYQRDQGSDPVNPKPSRVVIVRYGIFTIYYKLGIIRIPKKGLKITKNEMSKLILEKFLINYKMQEFKKIMELLKKLQI